MWPLVIELEDYWGLLHNQVVVACRPRLVHEGKTGCKNAAKLMATRITILSSKHLFIIKIFFTLQKSQSYELSFTATGEVMLTRV